MKNGTNKICKGMVNRISNNPITTLIGVLFYLITIFYSVFNPDLKIITTLSGIGSALLFSKDLNK